MLKRPVVIGLLLWIAIGLALRMGDYWYDFGVFVILLLIAVDSPIRP